MTTTLEPPADLPAPRPSRRPRRSRTRKPVRRFMVVSHRWLSLVLGLVLLVFTTTGALLLYRPELEHHLDRDAYAAADVDGPTIGFGQAWDAVAAAHPDFAPTSVVEAGGVYRVTDYTTSYTVDPHTGEVLGEIGERRSWIGFLDNLHECALSCEGMPGYVGFLADPMPHSGWLGHDGEDVSYGAVILGVTGLLLVYLCLSGVWLWFPRPRQWRSSMSVRWRRGRFARDTDLHKVAGMITLVPLLVWGVTAAGFELAFMEKAWYAVTPGKQVDHETYPTSAKAPRGTPDLTADQAVAAAQRIYPDARVVSVDMPAADDATAAYVVWFSDGFDPYGQTDYPGDVALGIDRHTGASTPYYGVPGDPWAQEIWSTYSYPVHAGYVVNGWWRLIWLFFALSPVLLGITGLSTWLVRRRTKRRRRRAAAQRA